MTVRDEDGFDPDEETDDGLAKFRGLCRDVELLTGMSTRTIGQQIRKTCLHDNGDGTFALTILVNVRAADIGEATEILAAGRRLQARFDA